MVLFTGKTVDEAIEHGLAEMKLNRLTAHIKIIAKEKKGFLGFGKREAQVEITEIDKSEFKTQPKVSAVPKAEPEVVTAVEELPKVQEEVVEVTESTEADLVGSDVEQNQEVDVQAEAVPEEEKAQKPNIDEAQAAIIDYLTTIIAEMDVEAQLRAEHTARQIRIQIDTDEAGRVIGYHGKVLKALQILAQNFLYARYGRHFSVSVNVHDYNEHRREALIDYSRRIAEQVLETGESFQMDSMSNQERKLVHKTIAKISGVKSRSKGEDPERYIMVERKP